MNLLVVLVLVLVLVIERVEKRTITRTRTSTRTMWARAFLGSILLLSFIAFPVIITQASDNAFLGGTQAYYAGDYLRSAEQFRAAAVHQPASGTLQNLGIAEWQRGSAGAAILAWEQSLWVDPFNPASRGNLSFARKTSQLEAPDLIWYEVVSTWLPANWWAWTAAISFWMVLAISLLPGILRRPKTIWHQALAALGLTVLLLTIPALMGAHRRSGLGFVLQKETALRLTPTQEAQVVSRLAAGEPARWLRSRGNYVLIRTSRAVGWIERAQFGFLCPRTSVAE